jgi:hypothetical protein
MRNLAFVVLLMLVGAGAFAQVSDLVLSGVVDRDVVIAKADGSQVSGQLSSYDAATVVVITAGGDVVEIARKDLKSVKVLSATDSGDTGPASKATPAATAPSGDAPAAPDFASVRGAGTADRQSAYDGQFKVIVDPLVVALKMGDSGRFYPLAQWEPVLRDVPAAYQLYKSYNGRRVTSTVFLIGGSVLLIPGTLMSFLGPYLVGIILDVGALTFDLVALLVQPSTADLQKIADAYNAQTRKTLQLSLGPHSGADGTFMGFAPSTPGDFPAFAVTLLSLSL